MEIYNRHCPDISKGANPESPAPLLKGRKTHPELKFINVIAHNYKSGYFMRKN